ncbi:hypothetical protein L7F22_037202 [Adiantum nelumboides]|nr:hypothetical protein [Adiantum nelumboides]
MDQRATTPPEDVEKLSQLSNISLDSIFPVLRDRFFSSLPYTALSDSILISANPFAAPGNRNTDDTLREYTKDYRETSKSNRARLPPHVFQLACNAYFYLRRTGQDQSILLAGETASGKTEIRRLALRTLIDLSAASPGKKGSKLAAQIPSGEFILESLGNSSTLENANASRFGKYTELQFSESGRLVGAKTLDYYLERNRVVSASSSERNFHIFYYLVAGASSEEKEFLHLGDGSDFRFLGSHSRQHKETARQDAAKFTRLKQAFKNVGLSKRHVASICQVLAAILHLGNLEFYQDRHRTQDSASIRNPEVLHICAEFLGITSKALEESLTYKTKMIKNEVCTILLDADGAANNRDELAKSIYSLLFAWINEHLNEKLCRDDFDAFIGVFDLPVSRTSRGEIRWTNSASTSPTSRCTVSCFALSLNGDKTSTPMKGSLSSHQRCLTLTMPSASASSRTNLVAWSTLWTTKLDECQRRRTRPWSRPLASGGATTRPSRLDLPTEAARPLSPLVTSTERWHTRVRISWSATAKTSVPILSRCSVGRRSRQARAHPKSEQTIVAAQQSVKPMRQPSMRKRGGTIKRSTTQRRGGADDDESDDDDDAKDGAGTSGGKSKHSGVRCVAGEFKSALDTLFETIEETKPWFVLCLRPNDNQLPNQFEARVVKQQIKCIGIAEMARKLLNEYSVNMTYEEFCSRYAEVPVLSAANMQGATGGEAKQKFSAAKEVMGWSDNDAASGRVKVFLSHAAFRELEDDLRAGDPEEVRANERKALMDADAAARGETDPFSPLGVIDESAGGALAGTPGGFVGAYGDPFKERSTAALPLVGNQEDSMDEAKSTYSDFSGLNRRSYGGNFSASASVVGSEAYAPSRNMFADANGAARGLNEKGPTQFTDAADGEVAEEMAVTSQRKRWVLLTWLLTWWIPSPFLKWCGGMKRPDIRMAWREKLAINMMIWFICGCAIFVIAVLGNVICPKQHVYSTDELQNRKGNQSLTAIRGEVFDLNNIVTMHRSVVSVVPETAILKYAGEDATGIFPVQVNALCNGVDGSVSPWVQLNRDNSTDTNAQYHDFRAIHPEDFRADWYYESMWLMRSNYRVGFMGYTPDGISDLLDEGRAVAIYRGGIYDVTDYVSQGNRGAIQAPENTQAPANTNAQFMSSSIIQLISQNPGKDITKQLDALPLSSDVMDRQRVCLRNLFFIGKQDNRNSPQCQFARYILLALSIVMVAIIGFKFLAALQFGRERKPEEHDKFVLCQVPCYTEGEESMRKTINSLAALKYDDKRKLIFIICDGMIVGSGNDRPTPRIVLDILGADPNLDPEPLSFLSLGEGSRQHNMAKVYSGLYEHHGHVVPYLVVVKCGKPTERQRPGNRGKRDSQLVLMRFLNKVHFGLPMNPMELEIYHQIKNVIGVNPSFYEYVLQVDADTEVEALSLNRFVSAFTNDKKVIGLCGETSLSNSKRSFITMLQVYEYFISHYLAKAFESLFGSVTCLPGCFSIFRIRTPDTHRPLFIANRVLEEYAENRVDTLHTKNLLHLGEDRYLTTLVLKHFGNYKTLFIRDAKAMTTAPEDWGVLLSQRRRWINSTVHNLFELISTPGLCGFCLFSMRFIVFIDLLSTIIAPVTMVYIVYLIVLVCTDDATVPVTSLIMLAAIYGLQAIIFLLRRRFDMIIWMLIYIVGTPVWTLFLPLYSFWHMDDFSWGNTRVVMGEKGQKIVKHDEGKFDPNEIPEQTWQAYEEELWERNSARSIGEIIEAARNDKSNTGSRAGSMYAPSLYGAPMMQQSPSYGHSPSASQLGGAMGGGSQVGTPGYFPPGQMDAARHSTYSLGGGMPQGQSYHGAMSGYGTPAMSMFGGPTATNPGVYASQPTSMYGMPQMQSQQFQSGYFQGSPSMYGQSFYQPQQQQQQQQGSGQRSGRSTPGPAEGPLVDASTPGAVPADDVVARDIRQLIMSSDLASVTKKKLRGQLEEKYGAPFSPEKKTFVNETIDKVLAEV